MPVRSFWFAAVLWLASVAPALAAPEFKLVRGREPLSTLEFEAESSSGAFRGEWGAAKGGRTPLVVKVRGRFTLENGSLLKDLDAVPVDPATGKLEFLVLIEAPETAFELKQIAADGTVQSEEFALVAEDWAALEARVTGAKKQGSAPKAPAAPVGTFSGMLGVALLDYEQTGVESFSQVGLSAKAAYSRWIFGREWALDANGYGTVLPITSRSDGVWVRQLGLNVRVGRRIWSAGPRWDLWVSGGAFAAWAISSDSTFGFRNLVSGQLYPVVSFRPSARDRFSAYLKYVPLFGLSQREIAVGLQYKRKRRESGDWVFGLDFSDISFNPSATTTLGASNVVLGVGLSQ